jgi:hypothetical protein
MKTPQELFKSLGLSTARKSGPLSTSKLSNAKKQKLPSGHPSTIKKEAKRRDTSTEPRRVSLRLKGIQPNDAEKNNGIGKEVRELLSSKELKYDDSKSNTALLSLKEALDDSSSSNIDFASDLLKETHSIKRENSDIPLVGGEVNEFFKSFVVDHPDSVKVTASRVYSMEFAPMENKLVAAVGDKSGIFALFSPFIFTWVYCIL